MNDLIYQELNPVQFRSAQAMSHDLWSGGLTLDERIARIESFAVEYAGIFRYVGLVTAEGQVLSSCKLYSCLMQSNGSTMTLTGIGAVFTDPIHRGKGLAAQMIVHVMEESRRTGQNGAFLWSDIGARYYEKFGFVRLPLVRYRYEVKRAPVGPRFRPAAVLDQARMQDLFDRRTKGLRLSCQRSELAWRFFRRLNGAKDYVVEGSHGKFCGYFSAALYSDYLWVDEAFAESGKWTDVWSSILVLAKRSKAKTVQTWHRFSDLDQQPELMVAVQKPIPMVCLFDREQIEGLNTANGFFGSLDHF